MSSERSQTVLRVHADAVPRTPRDYALFSMPQIGWTTFLFGAPAGLWMLGANYRSLGRRQATRWAIALGVAVAAGFVAVALFVSPKVPAFVFGLPGFLGVWLAANHMQGELIAAHRQQGGRAKSSWSAVGLGVLSIAVTIGIAFGIAAEIPEVVFDLENPSGR